MGNDGKDSRPSKSSLKQKDSGKRARNVSFAPDVKQTRRTADSNTVPARQVPIIDEARKKELKQEAIAEAKRRHDLDQETMRAQERLCMPGVTAEYFVYSARYFQPVDYDAVVEERALARMCGYPMCERTLGPEPQSKYRISMRERKVYDTTESRMFCCNDCHVASDYYKSQLNLMKTWLRLESEMEQEIRLLSYGDAAGAPTAQTIVPLTGSEESNSKSTIENQERRGSHTDSARVSNLNTTVSTTAVGNKKDNGSLVKDKSHTKARNEGLLFPARKASKREPEKENVESDLVILERGPDEVAAPSAVYCADPDAVEGYRVPSIMEESRLSHPKPREFQVGSQPSGAESNEEEPSVLSQKTGDPLEEAEQASRQNQATPSAEAVAEQPTSSESKVTQNGDVDDESRRGAGAGNQSGAGRDTVRSEHFQDKPKSQFNGDSNNLGAETDQIADSLANICLRGGPKPAAGDGKRGAKEKKQESGESAVPAKGFKDAAARVGEKMTAAKKKDLMEISTFGAAVIALTDLRTPTTGRFLRGELDEKPKSSPAGGNDDSGFYVDEQGWPSTWKPDSTEEEKGEPQEEKVKKNEEKPVYSEDMDWQYGDEVLPKDFVDGLATRRRILMHQISEQALWLMKDFGLEKEMMKGELSRLVSTFSFARRKHKVYDVQVRTLLCLALFKALSARNATVEARLSANGAQKLRQHLETVGADEDMLAAMVDILTR